MKRRKRILHPPKAVVEVIAAGLKEIEAHFEWEGFPPNSGTEAESQNQDSEPDDNTEEDDLNPDQEVSDDDGDTEEGYGGNAVFEREDIEVAIDVFLSRLVEDELIKKIKRDEQLSLSEVFERYFGEDHELTEAAQAFEEHIKGYFGEIAYEDMQQAYGELSSIRGMIDIEINRHAQI